MAVRFVPKILVWATACTALFLGLAAFLGLVTGSADEGSLSPPAGDNKAVFLIRGQPIDGRQPPLRADLSKKYLRALKTIPDAKSCLLDDGLSAEYADSFIDWEAIASLEHLNVCIFFVSAHLHSETLVKDWFEKNRFKVSGTSVISPLVMRLWTVDGAGKEFNAILSYNEFSGVLNSLASFVHPKYLTATITFDERGNPVNAQSSFSYK